MCTKATDKDELRIIRKLTEFLPTDIVRSIVLPYLEVNDCIQTTVLYGHESYVLSVCVMSDDKIVSGSDDCTVRIWDISSGKLLRTLRGHKRPVYSVYINNGNIVSLSRDKTARVWDINGRLIKIINKHSIYSFGDRVMTLPSNGTIYILNKTNGICTLVGHQNHVYSVCMTSSKIVSGSADKTVCVWDMNTGDLLHKLKHNGSVYSVCTTNDGKIVSGSADNTVRVWDIDTGDLLHTFWHNNWVSSVCAVCTATENIIISGSWDNTIRIWKKRTFDIQFSKLYVQPSSRCSLM